MSAGTASSGAENTLQLQLIPYTCIVCGSLSDLFLGPDGKRVEVKQEVIDNEDEGLRTAKQLQNESGDDIELFHFFLRAVGTLKFMAKKWNFESEPVPLCNNCKDKLCQLRSIDAELKRLELRMKDGVKDLKERMKLCEENFQREEVYERDERYHAIRSRVIGTKFTKNRPRKWDEAKLKQTNIHVKEPEENPNVRKSSRLSKTDGEFGGASRTVQEEVMEMEDTSDGRQEENFNIDITTTVNKPESPSPPNSPVADTENNAHEMYVSDCSVDTYRVRPRRAAAKRAKSVISDVVEFEHGNDEKLVAEKNPSPQSSSKSTRKVKPSAVGKKEECSSGSGSEWEESHSAVTRNTRKINSTRMRREKDVTDKTKPFRNCRIDEQTGKMRYLHVLLDAVDGGRWKCQECGLIMEGNKSQIRGHALASHLTRKCPHPYCDFEASNKTDCEDHYLLYHDEKACKHFACEICGKPKSNRINHRYTHCNEEEKKELETTGQFKSIIKKICDECGRSFVNLQSLRKHQVREHNYPESPKPKRTRPADDEGGQIHLCFHCGYIGKSEKELKRHNIARHPKPEDLRFVCIQCDRRFTKLSLLEKHKLLTHSDELPFQCNQCPKRFKLKKALNIHLMAHTGVRPFQCEHCPIAFLYKYHLQKHIKNYHLEGSKPGRPSYIRGQDKSFVHRKPGKKKDPESNNDVQSNPPNRNSDTLKASTSTSSMQQNEQESLLNLTTHIHPQQQQTASFFYNLGFGQQ